MACHLTFLERERISQMRDAGASKAEIATELGRAPSLIGREIKRNSVAGEYWAAAVQGLAQQRRREIAERSKSDFADDQRRQISHHTIYTWIEWQPPDDRRHFASSVRRAGSRSPREDRRGRIPNQVSIEARPKVVDQRRCYGDWEGNTVVGSQQSGAVVTLVERKSG
jgi:transposase, IS30 family